MKLLAAMTLGLFSLNAMALPVLTENLRIFGDSENSSKFYYVPDELNLYVDQTLEEIKFNVFKSTTGSGHLMTTFKTGKSERLENTIEAALSYGELLAKLPVTKAYMKINKKYEAMITSSMNVVNPNFNSPVYFDADLTTEGLKTLLKDLKDDPESVRLFSACYVIEGVSPELEGSYAYNLNKIYQSFSSLPKSGLSFSELRDEVGKLFDNDTIAINWDGEGDRADYLASITRTLIKDMFEGTPEKNSYSLVSNKVFHDKIVSINFQGREYVRKDFCLGSNFKGLKNYPEALTLNRM